MFIAQYIAKTRDIVARFDADTDPAFADYRALLQPEIEEMRAQIEEADENEMSGPALTLEQHEALYAEADAAKARVNHAWCAARWARNRWHQLHDEFTYALKVGDMTDSVQELSEEIDDLESRHPLLCKSLSARPPFPFAAPFI